MPPSLDSLLASRLDALGPGERAVLERAAVVGREFTRAAVDALTPDDDKGSTATELMALVRRRLVQPDDRETGEDAFLFEHALVRDAAYVSLTKADRARLHEQLARWLDERGELDEIVGHHLEQAVLGRRPPVTTRLSLVVEASDRLGAAGERAIWNDLPAAVALLSRAIDLRGRHDPRRLELECLLSIALRNVGQWRRADELLDDVAQRAADMGDRRLELRARVEKVMLTIRFTGEPDVERAVADVQDLVEEVAPLLAATGDDFSSARAWHVASWIQAEPWTAGRGGDVHRSARLRTTSSSGVGPEPYATPLAASIHAGPTPVSRGLRICRNLGREIPSPGWRSFVLPFVGALESMQGRADIARAIFEEARLGRQEFMDPTTIDSSWAYLAASAELLAGDPTAAETILVPACEALRAAGNIPWLAMNLAALADSLSRQARVDDAVAAASEAIDLAPPEDVWASAFSRRVGAVVFARAGRFEEARAIGSAAIELLAPTDGLDDRGKTLLGYAEVLSLVGDRSGAVAAARQAIELFEAKGNVVSAGDAARLLSTLE